MRQALALALTLPPLRVHVHNSVQVHVHCHVHPPFFSPTSLTVLSCLLFRSAGIGEIEWGSRRGQRRCKRREGWGGRQCADAALCKPASVGGAPRRPPSRFVGSTLLHLLLVRAGLTPIPTVATGCAAGEKSFEPVLQFVGRPQTPPFPHPVTRSRIYCT